MLVDLPTRPVPGAQTHSIRYRFRRIHECETTRSGMVWATRSRRMPLRCRPVRVRWAGCGAGAVSLPTMQKGDRFRVSALAAGGTRALPVRLRRGSDPIDPAARGGTPASVHASFCGTCGSPTPFVHPATGQFAVPAGSLEDDPECDAVRHIYVEHEASWYAWVEPAPRLTSAQVRDLRRSEASIR